MQALIVTEFNPAWTQPLCHRVFGFRWRQFNRCKISIHQSSDAKWRHCRRCSNYFFIVYLTPGFNRLGKDKCKTRRESFKFWDLVRLILEMLRYRYITVLANKFVTPRNEVPFWRLFIFYLLVRSKGRLVGRIYGIVCAILFNMYFGIFVMTFIDIG